MRFDSLSRRTVAATLLTAVVSSVVLAAGAALALRLLWQRHDLRELDRTAEMLERTFGLEMKEHGHALSEAAREVLEEMIVHPDRAEIRQGAIVVAEHGEGPRFDSADGLPEGWIGVRREMPGGFVLEVVRRPQDGLPLRRLFWAALLLAAIPSSLLALAVGRWAGRAAARPMEDLALRLGTVDHPRDYVSVPLEALPFEAAVLERAFSGVLGRLGAALDREAEFVLNAAHELRTPLTRIRLRTERAAAEASGECRSELEGLTSEVDRLARLVDALLVLSRDETSGLGAGETVNVADLVRASAEASAEGSGRAIALTAPDEALVRGDEDLLRLAVDNLFDNARKYAPAGSTPLAVLFADGGRVVLSVETPGVSLAEEERERVFDRFYRGAAAREAAPGHGLGLALARHVARFHGGDVVAAEGGEAKAVFELRLPGWRSGA